MEGADLQRLGGVARDQLANTLAHFLRRLVGEGDGGNSAGLVAQAQEMGDFLGDHAGLAGSGAREHEHRAIAVGNGVALGWVETHRQLGGGAGF